MLPSITPSYFPVHPNAKLLSELSGLRDRYSRDLFGEYFPFWDKAGVDHRNGGFFCWLDENGNRVSDQKYMWYQGRGLWVYSHAYRVFGKDPRFLEVAEKTYAFLMKHGRDVDGYWRNTLGPNGEPVEERDGMGYAGMFVAEGLQEFARAKKDATILDEALEAYGKSVKLFEAPERMAEPDYLETYPPGVRLLGHEMVKIRFLKQVLEQRDTPEFRETLRGAVAHVFTEFVHPEEPLCVEALDHAYRLRDDANRNFCLLGHAMETFWMIMDAGAFLKDESMLKEAMERYWTHHEKSWDAEKGIYRTIYDLKKGPIGDQVIWHYDETIIAFLMIYLATGSETAVEWLLKIDAHVEKTFRVEGEVGSVWLRDCDEDGNLRLPTGRIGNYHTARRFMLSLELLGLLK